MALSCQLKLAIFSVKLEFQDMAECGIHIVLSQLKRLCQQIQFCKYYSKVSWWRSAQIVQNNCTVRHIVLSLRHITTLHLCFCHSFGSSEVCALARTLTWCVCNIQNVSLKCFSFRKVTKQNKINHNILQFQMSNPRGSKLTS